MLPADRRLMRDGSSPLRPKPQSHLQMYQQPLPSARDGYNVLAGRALKNVVYRRHFVAKPVTTRLPGFIVMQEAAQAARSLSPPLRKASVPNCTDFSGASYANNLGANSTHHLGNNPAGRPLQPNTPAVIMHKGRPRVTVTLPKDGDGCVIKTPRCSAAF